ncbi:universal stress protein [Methyloferula stellata]|uniref:universal stress protein n=1 Tax=Methyloferula stellata TaxID=876270 RepID=UPI00039C2758|nr:universal stress protein [Methyloferula stellata]
MKAILIPVEDHSSMDAVMSCALMLARKFGSYMEGAALGPDFTELAASDFSFSGMIFDEKTRRELLDDARRKFETFMEAQGVGRQGEPGAVCSFGWMGPVLVTDKGLGEYGRVFDLIAVGKPDNSVNAPRRQTFESALFESGRPVLIVPPLVPQTLGDCIAIAWNGSSETARSVAFAMPLLTRARDVPVFNVPHSRLLGPTADDLTRSLRRHGVPARTVMMGDTAKAPGAALLEKAKMLGADLLIKGGYTQSRLRELIFGSVTSEILAEADLPVLMAH